MLNPRKAEVFLRRQRPRGGGFHRKSSNIAIGQFNALKSWPYTSKFTYDHPEQIETIFKSIGGFGKFWGAVEHVRSKIQILSNFWFSDFWSNFRFSYFFSPNRSQKLTKRARDLIFSLKCKAYMWALDPLWFFQNAVITN